MFISQCKSKCLLVIKDFIKFNKKLYSYEIFTRKLHSGAKPDYRVNNFIDFQKTWPQHAKQSFINDMKIIPDFLTSNEEDKILEEIEPYLKRLRYESDHWDDAIHGYRETERKHWYPHNRLIIQRVSDTAFNGAIMPYIHILDLNETGVIKPHVDSTRYCGPIIAGLSLLSDSVMRLVRTDEKKYLQNSIDDNNNSSSTNEHYRNQPSPSPIGDFYADILLRRRSLYIMSHSARYNFTHEILSNDNSIFGDEKIIKTRRVSIICRNEP